MTWSFGAADVFISYSRASGLAYAQRLVDLLLLKKKGIRVFADWNESEPGRELPQRLRRELRAARRLVVIFTNEATASPFVRAEVEEFSRTGRTVIPILADGATLPQWAGTAGLVQQTESASAFAPDNAEPSGRIVQRIIDSIGADTLARRTARAATVAFGIIILSIAISALLIAAARRELRRQQAVLDTTALANRADRVLRTENQLRYDAALLAAESMRRMVDLGEGSAAADLALRSALTRTARIERRFTLDGGLSPEVTISPDGHLVAMLDGPRVELIDVRTGTRRDLVVARRVGLSPGRVLFSGDSTHVASVSYDAASRSWVCVWRVEDGRPLGAPFTHAGQLESMALTTDGRHYATWHRDPGTVRVWNSATHAPASAVLPHGETKVFGTPVLRFSPTGRYLAASGNETGRIWEWQNGSAQATLLDIEDGFAFSEDEHVLVTTEIDVYAYSLARRKRLWTAERDRMHAESRFARDVKIFKGRVAIALDDDVEIRDLDTGALLTRIPIPDPIAIDLQWNLAVVGGDGSARLYRPESAEEISRASHTIRPLAVAIEEPREFPDIHIPTRIVSATEDEVLVWHNHTISGEQVIAQDVVDTRFAPDSGLLVTLDEDQRDGFTVGIESRDDPKLYVNKALPGKPAQGLAYGPRGLIAIGMDDGRLLLWDGKAEHAFRIAQKNLGGAVDDVHISPSGELIAATAGGEVAIFDTRGQVLAQFKSPRGTRSFVFTNEAEIVTADADDRLRWWRWQERPAGMRISVATDEAGALARTGDGLVALGQNGTVSIWNDEGKLVESIDHGGDMVTRIAADRDMLLATGGNDGMVRVWRRHKDRAAEETFVLRVQRNRGFPRVLAMSADGRHLALHNENRTEIHVLSHEALLALACKELAPIGVGNPNYANACKGLVSYQERPGQIESTRILSK